MKGKNNTFINGWSAICTNKGIRNPRVFPDPVWAMAITSMPARAIGQQTDWIAVGLLNPAFLSSLQMYSGNMF